MVAATNSRRPQREVGFTLVELMVTILIASILIGISVKAQFFPFPASPYDTAVFSAVGWLTAGVVLRAVMRRRHARNTAGAAFGDGEAPAFDSV